MWRRACGMGTCPKCGTDDKVEVFEMPTVPKGQVVIKVEGEDGGGGEGTSRSTRPTSTTSAFDGSSAPTATPRRR